MSLGLCDLSWVLDFGKPLKSRRADCAGGRWRDGGTSKRSGPETGKVQVSGRWAQRVAYANFDFKA